MESSGEKTIKLTQLDIACETSLTCNKYQLIFDSTENAEVFFRYKAHLIEVNKLSIGITLGKITREEAIETVRKGLVYSMRAGDRLVLFMGNIAIDWKNTFNDATWFPTDLIFNFAEWRKDAVYKKIVKPEEDVDLMGNKNCYFMREKFDLIILVNDADHDQENR